MERNLKASRIYSLKPYENLQLTNEINDIPEELIVDHELILNLNKLLLLEMEIQFNNYCMLREKTNKVGSLDEIRVLLEEERTQAITTLFDNKNFNTYLEGLTKSEDK
jgi:hypothetical protein